VRYPNEANAIKKLGGKVWRVNRSGYGPANDHPSEHALNDYAFDKRIDNSYTIDKLHNTIEGMINHG
jgi:predicted secreted protein